MKKLILINLLFSVFLINSNAFSQVDYPTGDDTFKKPIEAFHKKSINVVPPYDINANEETKSALPGIFTDVTRGDEERELKIEPEKGRSFYYGYHRTLQSLTDIGNEDTYTNQLNEMMKSKQVVAYITAAQTQPAAAAGLHYGTMNTQLTLVNQQLSHQSYFEQMSHMPSGAKLIQSMYTGCLGKALSKGSSFSEAHRSCIGDKAEVSQKTDVDIAKATDIVDHQMYNNADKPNIENATDDEKIACTDLIFEQQKNDDVQRFKDEFKNWFGDEITIIKNIEGNRSGAAVGRERVLPKFPLEYKYKRLVDERFQQFGNLMQRVCKSETESKQVATSISQESIQKPTKNNIWTANSQGAFKDIIGLLSIEGYEFNSLIAEALHKIFSSISRRTNNNQINCDMWLDCYRIVYVRKSGSNFRTYDTEASSNVAIAKQCKNLHDYSEAVALGQMIEIIARAKRIVMDFTSDNRFGDARSCGMRVIDDQIKTNNLEEVQFQAIDHLIKITSTVYKDLVKESGKSAKAGTSAIRTNKQNSGSE